MLLRDHRDTASAEAFFEQALGRSGQTPSAIRTHHWPLFDGYSGPGKLHAGEAQVRVLGDQTEMRQVLPHRSVGVRASF